jgi:DNA mismatch repair protein MutS
MDDSSRRNLELTENMRDGTSDYSLLECVNFSKTAMGFRLLRNWILFPLTNLKQIEDRQNRITTFYKDRTLLEKVRADLSNILDVERLTGRIAMDKAHPKDIQALRFSLEKWISVKNYLEEFDFSFISSDYSKKIIDLVKNSILEDPSTSLTEGGIIKEGWSEELDHWRNIHNNFNKVLMEYEAEEREKTGINNLKIKYTNASGYFIEVSKGKLSNVPPHFIMRRVLVNGDRYTTERLQSLEMELNESSTKILELERDLFIEVRTSIQQYISYLLQIADEISNTDVISCFAFAAIKHNWVCPTLENSTIFEIKNGRHPVVENHLPTGEFVPNDSYVCSDDENLPSFNLITGPNMAGKSTYMRQLGIITIMAQIGCFVPAKKATLPIFDKIFTRIGASDDLVSGESTFMVEMTEAANAIKNATSNSLILFDELGRGTATFDGMSLAQAILEYINNKIACKTLFSTHYHELTDLENTLDKLKNKHVSAEEKDGKITFLHKVKDGSVDKSYGINVARLANLPKEVTDRAEEILKIYEKKENDRDIIIQTSLPLDFHDNKNEIEEEIKNLNILELTPIDAINKLYELKNKTLTK